MSLRTLYSEHAFYIQVSMAEGFPNALSEAMCCGCVPIGSAVYSIPEIIGTNGMILHSRNSEDFKVLLNQAKNIDTDVVGKAASDSIKARFPIARRRKELTELVKKLALD
ncbi:MAG: glycosyltransferase, partial [Flavobacteriales bacterium]